MPLFAKCFNPDCFCFGQYQEAKGACGDCGAPLHGVPEETSFPMYAVLFSGPSPLVMPIPEALSEGEAAAKALGQLPRFGLDPKKFKVEGVFGPKEKVQL